MEFQAITIADEGKSPSKARLMNVLSELLATGNVEIGQTHQAKPDYLEFVAWNGSIEERISRAVEAVDAVESRDADFAYWLCLRENVDRFETTNE